MDPKIHEFLISELSEETVDVYTETFPECSKPQKVSIKRTDKMDIAYFLIALSDLTILSTEHMYHVHPKRKLDASSTDLKMYFGFIARIPTEKVSVRMPYFPGGIFCKNLLYACATFPEEITTKYWNGFFIIETPKGGFNFSVSGNFSKKLTRITVDFSENPDAQKNN